MFYVVCPPLYPSWSAPIHPQEAAGRQDHHERGRVPPDVGPGSEAMGGRSYGQAGLLRNAGRWSTCLKLVRLGLRRLISSQRSVSCQASHNGRAMDPLSKSFFSSVRSSGQPQKSRGRSGPMDGRLVLLLEEPSSCSTNRPLSSLSHPLSRDLPAIYQAADGSWERTKSGGTSRGRSSPGASRSIAPRRLQAELNIAWTSIARPSFMRGSALLT